jgi:NitT/TauT family transport system ATP-binding protein
MSANNGSRTPLLRIDRVSKSFAGDPDPLAALQAVSFQIVEGELVCLLGPSGSGKSTLLRVIGGLLPPDSGSVYLNGKPVDGPQEEVGFVFQTTNLMPWRTVLQNVLLPLEIQRPKLDDEDREHAIDLLKLVGLQGFEQLYPKQLSGGMRQRVVLARTLIHGPRLLLMDEPFGALDALTRERLNLELLHIHSIQSKTILMVTHSIQEAVFLSDRVIIVSERPAHIVGDVPIDLPRPRTLDLMGSERFGQLSMQVRHHIGHVSGHGA